MLAASPEQVRRRTGEAVETILQWPAWANGGWGREEIVPQATELPDTQPHVFRSLHEGAVVAFAVHCRADGKRRAEPGLRQCDTEDSWEVSMT